MFQQWSFDGGRVQGKSQVVDAVSHRSSRAGMVVGEHIALGIAVDGLVGSAKDASGLRVGLGDREARGTGSGGVIGTRYHQPACLQERCLETREYFFIF